MSAFAVDVADDSRLIVRTFAFGKTRAFRLGFSLFGARAAGGSFNDRLICAETRLTLVGCSVVM